MYALLTGRLARLRADGDRGFALIFVLFVTTVVMIGTATTLAVTTGGIKPSRQNQDNAAALSAAQAGVQRLLAALNANCPSASIAQCGLVGSTATSPIVGIVGSQKYTVNVVNPGIGPSGSGYLSAANKGTLIITSRGVSPVNADGSASAGAVTRTVTAAVSSKPSPLALAYFSNYETVGSTFLNNYFGPRKIVLDDPAVLGALGINSVSATVTWNGASLSAPTGLGDNICDKLWYRDPSNVNDGDPGQDGRSTMKAARTTQTSMDFARSAIDYREDGTLQLLGGGSSPAFRYAPCETTFTAGQNFNGSVYSRDAFYLSNSTTGGSGPKFAVPTGEAQPALWTGWQSINTPAADVQNPYRSFPVIGGAPASGSGPVLSSPYSGLALPSTTGVTAGTCTFSGPTTVRLSGSNALVTSPLTTSPGSTCTASVSGGIYSVPVTTTTLYVQNASGANPLSSNALANLLNLPGSDITYYSKTAGDAYVSGTLSSGKLSLVTDNDIIVAGNVLASHAAAGDGGQPTTPDPASKERSWLPGSAAIDLVATNDVRVYHPVSCASGLTATYGASAALAPSASAPNGWCPNDMTGLYQTKQSNLVVRDNGTLRGTHPSLQYTNLAAATEPSEIDAAIFALNGSFRADNFDRATGLGPLTVSGGVYQNHHGLLGEEWETPNGSTTRAYAGFKLKINYLDYSHAGLGYVPELTGGNDLQPWQVINVVSGGAS